MRLLVTLALTALFASAAFGGPTKYPNLVAQDRFQSTEQYPHLVDGEIWHFDTKSVAPSSVDARDSNRYVAFGGTVELHYLGLRPDASYLARIKFLSDSSDRVMRVLANGKVLDGRIELSKGKIATHAFELLPDIGKGGKLELRFERIAGANAVVSSVEIWSTDKNNLSAPVSPLLQSVPRLSPRPVSVAGVQNPIVDLNGTWQFKADPNGKEWSKIQVPGEWTMQGFTVKPNTAASYVRNFTVPADWKGQRIKLRCDSVYSDATIWINGQKAGHHLGTFTPFELDVTDLVKPGENQISMAVINESLADVLASGSQYAAHPLGGILRKIYLFATPKLNISSFHATTRFETMKVDFGGDPMEVESGILIPQVEIANESNQDINDAQVLINLKGFEIRNYDAYMPKVKIPAGETIMLGIEMQVNRPSKWDPEHPNLYQLSCILIRNGKEIQTISQKFGFRQIEVRGNQVFVNNMPIKLRGVCRHEVHPTLGRALTPELWRKDAEIFRAGNCNFIRTSHYPPAEEFLDACDELGMFVELEAPLCWVGHDASKVFKFKNAPNTPTVGDYLLQANLETVQAHYNHPSVIIHSLANESTWTALFAAVHKAVKQFDPTRPCTFHDQCWGKYNHGSTEMPIGIQHYPGPSGPARAANESRPIQFGEYCHLNAYNRHELVTDPGVRDAWGIGFAKMWEAMRLSKGTLGGSIWAAIDDSFFVPPNQTVGYGTWGPIDGWRRLKPEYWHMKKVYSPVRVTVQNLKLQTDTVLRIPVENRHFFSNFNEIRVDWKLNQQHGSLAGCNIPPGGSGVLEIPLDQHPEPGSEISLSFTNALGVELDREQLVIGKKQPIIVPENAAKHSWSIDKTTGQISLKIGDKLISIGGPHLMVLPLNGSGGTQMHGVEPSYAPFTEPCANWKASKVKAENYKSGNAVIVTGSNADAHGHYSIVNHDQGELTIEYEFTMNKAINPRQVGMVFDLPREMDTLNWNRIAQWSCYPEDHIGRPVGKAVAFPKNVTKSGPAGPRTQPSWSWSQDCNELGSNDFRSTKFNIIEASLNAARGPGIRVTSDGSQHVRAWIDHDHVRLAVLDFANAGAEGFFRSHAAQWDKPLKKGSVVKGTIHLQPVGE